jgi:RNA polymerase sigma factor (sigma-70 family)
MESIPTEPLWRHCCRLAAVPSDRELVRRFAAAADEAAFAALVRRHGPMVLGVCRRLLQNPQDAEDAFQATFLVLARKAGTLQHPESVGNYLYGVAYRRALGARAAAARRSAHEGRAAPRAQADPLTEITLREAQEVLDAELSRLPEQWRAPLVLCCLDGMTRDEAARQLGLPLGTLKSRLERGRELLRSSLTRRGLTLSAALSATLLGEGLARAALPPGLTLSTLRAAVGGPGQAAAGSVVSSPAMLAVGGTRLKVGIALLLTAGLVAAGAGLLAHQGAPPEPPRSEAPPPGAAAGSQVRTDRSGDALPEEAAARLGTTRLRHGVFVSWLRFTPDGRSLVSQGGDGVRIWETTNGKQLRFVPNEREDGQMPHEGSSLSSDGKLLAVPGKTGVHLVEVATGRRLRTFATGLVDATRFSPDGKVLAVQSEQKPWPFELWDTAAGQRLRSGGGDSSYFACLEFSADGKALITGGSRFQLIPPEPDYLIRFWDPASGKELRRLHLGPSNPRQIALSPDGKLLAVIGQGDRGTENRVRIWDVAAGKETRQLIATARVPFGQVTNYSTALAFAPDGRTLYTGGIDGTLIAWDPATGRELRRIGRDFISPRALAVSPDNKTLAADMFGHSIRIFDLGTGRERLTPDGHLLGILRLLVTPDGRTVVTGDPYHVLVWEASTGRLRHRLDREHVLYGDMFLLPDGRSLATLERDRTDQVVTLRVSDLATGKELRQRTWPGKANEVPGLLAMAADGKMLTLDRHDNTMLVKDLDTGKRVGSFGTPGPGVDRYGLTLTPDGRGVVTWDSDHRVRRWDLATGREAGQFTFVDEGGPRIPVPAGSVGVNYTAVLAPDGHRIALCSGSGFIALHDLATGRLLRKVEGRPDGPVVCAFSPDGKTLACSTYFDTVIHLVETATGRERHRLAGHTGQVTVLAFTSDGRTLVSGDEDTTAVVWDLTGGHRSGGARRALSPADLDACWSDLAGADAARAYRAIRSLAASAAEVVPYLAARLPPVETADEKRLAGLLADLDSDDFRVRAHALKELEGLGRF